MAGTRRRILLPLMIANGVKPNSLAPGVIEIVGIEPRLESRPYARPFFRHDRIPGGIPASSFVDDCATENSFECEPVALRCRTGRSIQAVALPLVPSTP